MTPTSPEDQHAAFGAVETVPMSGFQKVVARRLTQSWTQIPHVTHHDDIDVTALDAHRKALGPDMRISPLIFLAKALARALAAFPNFNASLSDDGKMLVLKRYFHIGIAVDGPLGLLVPVLRDVDDKDVATLAAELAALSAQARDKGLPMSAMSRSACAIQKSRSASMEAFTLAICVRASANSSNTPINMPL